MKLSVITITYNHEKYIQKTLKSLVSQKTKFNFEILVADDSSKDKTYETVSKYSSIHSNIIPIKRRKNVGMMKNFIDVFKKARGKYIALCEGDDYWIDPYKLQKQVDFLENNSEYSICFHAVDKYYQDKDKFISWDYGSKPKTFTLKNMVDHNFIPTCSVVYCNQYFKTFPEWFWQSSAGDWPLHIMHAKYGKIYYLPDKMAVYRVHDAGAMGKYGGEHPPLSRYIEYAQERLKLYPMIDKYLDYKVHKSIKQRETIIHLGLILGFSRQLQFKMVIKEIMLFFKNFLQIFTK